MAPAVTLDRDGLKLDGAPFYLLAGCVHYFRWPRAEWCPLIEQASWAGLNTIDTVIPWNRHEPQPGQFDFADEADLGAFLDLCQNLGLKAIVRPGPYICAEWENGGLPAWLTAMPGISLRVDDARYMAAIERWFDRLMAIIGPRQYPHGPVILCQIENEHWASGVYAHDAHQQSLAAAASTRGIVVPQYTCMGAIPAWPELRNGWSGIAEKLVQSRTLWPENPMIVSELWSGWFDQWGASRQTRKTAAKLDITLHQLTAVGAAGFSHWMWAGGTNFGYWGGRTIGGDLVFMTTSYDYDAPISEYGELRAKALVARRHHLFLGSLGARLAPVLADALPSSLRVIGPPVVRGRSEAGAQPYRTVRAGPNAPAAWRDFQATFLQNPGQEGVTYQIYLDQPAHRLTVEVEPASIRPIFVNLPLVADELSRADSQPGSPLLAYHTGRILGFWAAEATDESGLWEDVLIIYGQPGEQGELGLRFPDATVEILLDNHDQAVQLVQLDDVLQLRYWLTRFGSQIELRYGTRILTLLLLPQDQADQVGAPSFDTAEQPGDDQSWTHWVVKQGSRTHLSELPVERLAVVEAATSEGWQLLECPEALERLGCPYGYGWYRAELELEAPLATQITAPWLSDRARVLLDGVEIGWLGLGPDGPQYTLPLELSAGRHDLRLLVDNLGRFNYGLGLGELKGLLDTLYLDGKAEDISHGWSALWQEVQFAGEAVALARPGAFRPDATDVDLGRFAFEGPAVWLLRMIETQPGRRYLLHLSGDRSSGGLFVNGQAIERFSRHRSGGLIKAEISAMLKPGPNLLALNLQGYAGAPWRATMVEYDPARPLPARWSFCPGVTPGAPLMATGAGPAFYRASFNRAELPIALRGLMLRVGALAKGQIWLNGHNIARFWQLGPQEDYKLPVAWLAEHNELLIFAETGQTEWVTLYGW